MSANYHLQTKILSSASILNSDIGKLSQSKDIKTDRNLAIKLPSKSVFTASSPQELKPIPGEGKLENKNNKTRSKNSILTSSQLKKYTGEFSQEKEKTLENNTFLLITKMKPPHLSTRKKSYASKK